MTLPFDQTLMILRGVQQQYLIPYRVRLHAHGLAETAKAVVRGHSQTYSNATRGTRSKIEAKTSEVLSGCMKRGANGTMSSVQPMVHAVAEC